MDENYNDYNYLCPLCNCGIFDENETTGRCDCGQLIIIPSLDSWLEGFKKTHKWSNKKQTWYYGWVKVLEVYKRGDYRSPDKTKSLVKVQHTVFKDDTTGFIRYFRPMDLVNTSEE